MKNNVGNLKSMNGKMKNFEMILDNTYQRHFYMIISIVPIVFDATDKGADPLVALASKRLQFVLVVV